MELSFFFKGLTLGFAVAAPVGPIGLLCIRRSLALGQRHGFVTGLGAATADALYGVIAGFGLTAVSSVLVAQQNWTRLIGGLFLAYLGVKTAFSKASSNSEEKKVEKSNLAGSYFSSLFLTVTNPMTILSFVAAFSGLGLTSAVGNYLAACSLVFGVFAGSATWWLFLSSVSGRFRSSISPIALTWINRLSGGLILLFAILALGSLIGG